MSPKLNAELMDVISQVIEQQFNIGEMVEAVDNIIQTLQMKFSMLDRDSFDKEEIGFMFLLMATVQAYEDGIADIVSDKVGAIIQQMYLDGELPEATMERMRDALKEAAEEAENESTDDSLPPTDVDELDIRNGEREPSGVASADA